MSRIRIAAVALAVAASALAAPAAQANPLDEVVGAVKCVGDALGGHACHG